MGTYTITYDAIDAAGNAATQVTRTVNIVDTTAPTITLTGNPTITIEAGDPYSDQGATASDNLDGDISANIITVNPVDNGIPGTYTITYNVADTSNNNATQVTRTVVVEDTTPPVITLNGSASVNIEAGTPYFDEGVTYTDNSNDDLSSNVVTVNDVDTNILQTYIITYNLSDNYGNAADQVTRTVNVVDNISPAITLLGDPVVTQEVFAVYDDQGANALDSFEGDITGSIVTVNPVNYNVLGTYTVSYNVSDSSGNDANEVTRTVNIVDTTAPEITLTGDPTVTINAGDDYTDQGATALDNVDGDISESIITTGSVDTDVLGTYTIKFNVSDAIGNPAIEMVRTVNVVDNVNPVITLIGDPTITIEAGDPYSDQGATASDNLDGDISANIITVNPVDNGIPGTYTITYNVADTSNNNATQVTRTVVVEDTTNPSITLLDNNLPLIIPFNGIYDDPGVETSDNSTTPLSLTDNITVSNPNTSITGAYTITYTVKDSSDNAESISRTVYVGPQADAGADQIICEGEELSIGFSGANPTYNYTWTSSPLERGDGGSNFVNLSPPYAPTVSPDQPTEFELTVTTVVNGVTLEETDKVLITVVENPVAAVIENTEICSGESISIGAPSVAGSTYQWTSDPPGFSSTLANPTVTPTQNIIYYLTETKSASSNCTASNAVEITVAPLAVVSAGPADTICESETPSGYRLDQASSNMIDANIGYSWTALGGDGTFDDELF